MGEPSVTWIGWIPVGADVNKTPDGPQEAAKHVLDEIGDLVDPIVIVERWAGSDVECWEVDTLDGNVVESRPTVAVPPGMTRAQAMAALDRAARDA